MVKNLPASAGDASLIPGPGRFHILVLSCESHIVMSNSLQPLGLYSPWNSPSQNTGVGSLSLLQRIFPEIKPRSHTLQVDTWPAKPQRKPRNTGVGSLCLLQQIFPTQGMNPGLPHCRLILYQLSHKGSPRILEWVAYPFSSGSAQPRNQTEVSWIAGGFFNNWAIREAP